jgi:uncharacterized protein (TIGR02246 family)
MKGKQIMSTEDEIREVSKRFYTALNSMTNGDPDPLGVVWSHGETVTAMHPIGGRQVGWDAVRKSFEQVAELASDGKIELKDQVVRVIGDVAYEVGVEGGHLKLADKQVSIEHRVTNIYQRQEGAWRIIHHHTDTSPAMIDAIKRLQPASAQAGR